MGMSVILRSENRFLNLLVKATTVVVVICYSWLAAHLLEPQLSLPTSIVSSSFLRTPDSRLHLFADQSRFFACEASLAERELAELEPLLNWLGPLRQPLEILIDEKEKSRLSITDSRIEMGSTVLFARGQLTKAILKSWILQNASVTITSSHLRTEIASDVLLGMLTGAFSLGVPGVALPLEFDAGEKPWWSYADSYRGVCASPWKSLELLPLCQNASVKTDAVVISNLSFRGFIGSRIWKSYQATPVADRLPFVRRWVLSLTKDRDVEVHAPNEGWLTTVQGELEMLLPIAMDPLAVERTRWLPKIEAPLIVIDSNGRVAAPGTLKLSSNELEIGRARMAVLTVCSSPSLNDVLNLKQDVERVVWRPQCADHKIDFVQVRPSAIRMALARGFAKASDKLDQFILKNRELSKTAVSSRMLGLADAKWDSSANAFRVRGPIQAVEAFRLTN